MSNCLETIWMKCQALFSVKNKKNIFSGVSLRFKNETLRESQTELLLLKV